MLLPASMAEKEKEKMSWILDSTFLVLVMTMP